jgi:hypothetical protein
MLLAAKKPFVIAGGGGWTPQAAQALQRFAENWKLPVGNAFRFQDTASTTTIRCTPATSASASIPSWRRACGKRPDPRDRPAPGRDDHRRLHAADAAQGRSRSWCTSTPAPRN